MYPAVGVSSRVILKVSKTEVGDRALLPPDYRVYDTLGLEIVKKHLYFARFRVI